ncbi:MAG: polyphosphate polymerase domain-containing protein [Flavobacteriales bacterium]|nr:polyphosphate polymerase domain-containing protein [Flavobacteriales bacterium]
MSTSSEYTVLETARFERKFVLENQSLAFAENMIKMNCGAFRDIYKKRTINNIYFDTPNLTNYYDNHFGKSNRTKIRIRWYGDTFGEIKRPILEFKMKFGAAGKKKSFPLKSFTLNDRFTKSDWLKLFNASDLPEFVLLELKSNIPTLLNSYERKYFQSFDALFRFTLDYNLSFFNIRLNNNRFLEKSFKEPTKIIELKYDLKNDRLVKNISSTLPIRLNKFSKYVRGIEIFNPHLAV